MARVQGLEGALAGLVQGYFSQLGDAKRDRF